MALIPSNITSSSTLILKQLVATKLTYQQAYHHIVHLNGSQRVFLTIFWFDRDSKQNIKIPDRSLLLLPLHMYMSFRHYTLFTRIILYIFIFNV